jgi:hypothetical protein
MEFTKLTEIELPAAFDAHVHLRDGEMSQLVTPTIRSGGVNQVYVMVSYPCTLSFHLSIAFSTPSYGDHCSSPFLLSTLLTSSSLIWYLLSPQSNNASSTAIDCLQSNQMSTISCRYTCMSLSHPKSFVRQRKPVSPVSSLTQLV